ncbi:MAG: hypothetical protein NC489_30480 [Ruminococcus flavefaciens]|nr:hypothetical protein [Ruminococcus flavefaciens]
MLKPDTYKIIREYKNQYGLDELIRRIIRCHLDEFGGERTGLKFPERIVDNPNEQLAEYRIYG